MADERAKGKRLIGAKVAPELQEAVDLWVYRNQPKTVTDFITEACLEKLKAEGISVDEVAALRDRRGRLPAPGPAQTSVNYKKVRTSAELAAAQTPQARLARRRSSRSKRQPTSGTASQAPAALPHSNK